MSRPLKKTTGGGVQELKIIVISNYLVLVAFVAFVESDEGGKQEQEDCCP